MTAERKLADREQRQQALDPSRSFIVRAPAGSGKTGLLIERYLTLLARAQEPEEVLAITFTRKAATEMRQRVTAALQSPADSRMETTARAVAERDRLRHWGLAENPDRLKIQTIDALNTRLASSSPLRTGGGGRILTEEPDPLYRRAAERTLAHLEDPDSRWGEQAAKLVLHRDGNIEGVIALLSAMLAQRDQWLPHVTTAMDRASLENSWDDLTAHVISGLEQLIGNNDVEEIAALQDYADSHLPDPQSDDAATSKRDAKRLRWNRHREMLLTQKHVFRKSVNVRNGFPAGDAGKVWKDRYQTLVERLKAKVGLEETLAGVQTLPSARYDEAGWDVLEALLQLLPLAAAELELVLTEQGSADFVDVARRALASLGEEQAPSDLALILDSRIQHLLVDEFQDTSWPQLSLIRRLTAGWQADDGRTLFLVGDPMQSIYRFRSAEVGIFLEVMERGTGSVDIEPLTLQSNFRSGSALVDWVNHSFMTIMPPQADAVAGAVPFSPSVSMSAVQDSDVQCHPLLDASVDDQARVVAEIVRRALEETPDGVIAVLARTRLPLSRVARALRAMDIPFRAFQMEPLGQRMEVVDIHNLGRLLDDPENRLALFSLMRSPLVGLGDNDLMALAAVPNASILDSRQDASGFAGLSSDGARRVKRMTDGLRIYQVQTDTSLVNQLLSAWRRLGGPAVVDDNGLSNVREFLNLLERHGRDGATDWQSLDHALARAWSTSTSSPDTRVELMTIHAAKGLEFDTVIIPALDRRPRSDEPELLVWADPPGSGARELPLFAPIPRRGDDDQEAKYRYLRYLERQRDRMESRRLLYVACTRAVRRLHLVASASVRDGELKAPYSDSLLGYLWHIVGADFHRLFESGHDPDSPADAGTVLSAAMTASLDNSDWRLSDGWQIPTMAADIQPVTVAPGAGSEDAPEFDWAGETARVVGTVVHRMLERIGAEGLSRWNVDRVRNSSLLIASLLKQFGIPEGRLEAAAQRVSTALLNIIDDQRGRWILSDEHQHVRSEWSVMTVTEGRLEKLIIDRSFVDSDGVHWIVDFKTSFHEGGGVEMFLDNEMIRYRPQLERYARAVSTMEYGEVKLGLYFPLLRGWRSWDYRGSRGV